MLTRGYQMATDVEFRQMSALTNPPRAGKVLALEASGQVRIESDDPEGGDVLAWPLNGFEYGVGDIVYVAFPANQPDGAIVLGARSPLPALGLDEIQAADSSGLRLVDDAGNLGILVEDGGNVGIRNSNPDAALHVGDTGGVDGEILVQSAGGRTLTVEADDAGNFTHMGTQSNHSFLLVTNDTPRMHIMATGNVGFFDSVINPSGRLHAHDGTGGMIFVTKTGISNVAQIVIPDSALDVTGEIVGFSVWNNGGSFVANTFLVFNGSNVDVVVGSGTWRLAVAASGQLTVARIAGTGTATMALLGVWL